MAGGRFLPKLAACASSERSDHYNKHCALLLGVTFSVRICSASNVSTVPSLMALVDAWCSACLRVLRTTLSVFDSPRFMPGIPGFSAVKVAELSVFPPVLRRVSLEYDLA